MIEAYTGLPGQGKTYLMTKLAIKKMRKGHRVFANYPLIGAERYQQIEELFEIRRLPDEKRSPVILIDEAGLIAPSGSWKAIPFEVMSHWRQHRHAGVDIWYTAQDLRDVAVPLRRVTQFVNEVSKFGPIFTWRTYNPVNKAKYGGGFTFYDSDVGKQYDTHAESVAKQNYIK